MTDRVLVTGGSGVVGGAVIRHLVAAGAHPRALSRSTESDRKLEEMGAEPIRGDVLDPASLKEAMVDVDLVFNVAGVNQMCHPDPVAMYAVNVTGARNVVRAAAEAEVKRVVHTSSAAALGEAKGTVGVEDTPHRGRFLSHYERSKHLAELAVGEEATGIEVVVVNPSSVQGPGRATGTGKLILDLLNGKLPALVDTRLSIVDIDDCAAGHLLAAERGKPGERYVLSSFTLEMREAVEMLSRVSGRPLRVRFVPGWVASVATGVIERAARLAGKKPPVCREMVRTLRHGHAYDGSKAARELGLRYTKPEDLLRRLVAWFEAEWMVEPVEGSG